MKYIIFSFIICLFALSSCKNTANEVAAEDVNSIDQKPTAAKQGQVHFTDQQLKAVDLQLGVIEKRNLTTALKINGKLTLPPQHQAQVSILNSGIVKSILVQEGDFVKEGKILAVITNTDIVQTQQDYLENNANLMYLEKEFQRQKQLRDENINAGKTYQQAQRDLQIAQARKSTLQSKLMHLGIQANQLSSKNISTSIAIVAPISGYIQHINLSIGKFADANSTLFEIIDTRYLHLDLKVFEKDIHKVREGQQIIFNDANDVTHSHPATIFAINKAFEPNEQAVLVHAKINEITETLLPGMYVEARVKLDHSETTALPNSAIVNNGDEHFIFMALDKNTFQQVKVHIGASDMGYTEVVPLDSIPTDANIVIKGAYYLLSELTKGSGEEE